MYSARTLTENEAEEIAQAYYRSGKNPQRMAKMLDGAFDLTLMTHPLVKMKVAQLGAAMRKKYSLEDHLSKLQEIRDAALDDGNYKVALTAEVAVGKAAGLYETIVNVAEDLTAMPEPTKLSTEEIRKKLALMSTPVLPAPDVEEEADF